MKKLATLSFLSLVLVLTACTGKSETSEKAEPVSEEVVETSEETTVGTEEVVEELVLKEEEPEPEFVELTDGEVKSLILSEVEALQGDFKKRLEELGFTELIEIGDSESINQVKAQLSGEVTDELMDTALFPYLVFASTCNCEAIYDLFPNYLEDRFEVTHQDATTIKASFLDFGLEFFGDISAFSWNVNLINENGSWKFSEVSKSPTPNMNLTFEEIRDHRTNQEKEYTLVEEKMIDGEEYIIAKDAYDQTVSYRKSDGKGEMVSSVGAEHEVVVEEVTTEVDEDKPFDINDPIMEVFPAPNLSLDDLSTYEHRWTDYTDQSAGHYSVDLTYLGNDLFDINILEASIGGQQLENYDGYSIKLNKNILQFSFDFAGHSDSKGDITIELKDNGIRYIKKITDQQPGGFNFDIDTTLTKIGLPIN
ncbi:hypothetical protein MKX54_17160 [Alkalihalobacillus sp. FSL R5-0424]